MCGIIGILGINSVAERLMEGLKRLEYRGYDSAGIATLNQGEIGRRRASGKLKNLVRVVSENPIAGHLGIGHTRWATHGVPSEENAHPHMTERVAVVHNGIIENYRDLREMVQLPDSAYASQTDTEVIAHLLDHYLADGLSPADAVQKMLPQLQGAFALVMIFRGYEDMMIGARLGSPLALGIGEGGIGGDEMFFGSDAMALAPMTNKICYLQDGDWAVVTRDDVTIYNGDNMVVDRPITQSALTGAMIGKGNYRHFMLKEIYEQPSVIGETLSAYLNPAEQTITLPEFPFDLRGIDRISISACGTAFYAGMVAKYWIESLARLPVELDFASEMRYRQSPLSPNGLAIFISQSGETMDTLEALRYCKSQDQKIVSVLNVAESTIARESDAVLLTKAGPEIGVASTKAFTTQLTVLACLAITLAKAQGKVSREQESHLASVLTEVPGRVAEVLNTDKAIETLSHTIAEARDVLYLGRGLSYPIALEGALKLKEISYIHAEGYAAGEMKHGPIALIDENVPIVAIAPTDNLFEKTASNIQETIARGGQVVFMSDAQGIAKMTAVADPICCIELPHVDGFVAPILYTIPVQLLSYHTAVQKGTDVDQPRNLAKSVTVE